MAAHDFILTLRNDTDTGSVSRRASPSLTEPSYLGFDPVTNLPEFRTADELPAGPQGPQGPQGDAGPKGDKGDPGESFELEFLSRSPSLTTPFTLSATRNAWVTYTVKLRASTVAVAASSESLASLQYSSDSGATWQTVSKASLTSVSGLTVSLGQVDDIEGVMCGFIPAGAQVRILNSANPTGGVTLVAHQEVLL